MIRSPEIDRLRLLAAACVLALAGPALAEDRADLDRTRIIGNRELPKMLYIVPWKQPAPGDLTPRPMHSVLDETLDPLDRDVFRREVRYHAAVAAGTPSRSAQAAAPATPEAAPGERPARP